MKRREFLKSTSLASGLACSLPLIQPGFSWAANQTNDGNILVCVFLGGGADGLSIIAPVGEGHYHDLRPSLALKEPGSGSNASLDLDGFFAMHPVMDKLYQRYNNGELAVIQATGLTSDSHSHFDSQSFMERGITSKQNVTDGWLNRHLALLANQDPVFNALGLSESLPLSLVGSYPAINMSSIDDYGLNVGNPLGNVLNRTLTALYQQDQLLDSEARKALSSVSKLQSADPGQYMPENGANYPDTEFGQRFKQLGQIIRADLGLSTACLTIHGWDHHDNEADFMPDILGELSNTLDAFATDMGIAMNKITVITMSEFGRRAQENASAGFDHGYGGFMLALGGGVAGGHVYGDWPGLAPENLVFTGDLDITTDYRSVIAELLANRFGQTDFATIFPDWNPSSGLGIFS